MRRDLLRNVRERRTWPKFAGAVCLAAAVIIPDGYVGLIPTVIYLFIAAVLLNGLPKRYAMAAVGISFFAAAAFLFGYMKMNELAYSTLVLPAKIVTLAWVSAYLYTITPPPALVGLLARLGRPMKIVRVRADFWTSSLGFAFSAVPAARHTAAEAVTAARLRGASAAKGTRRMRLAGLVTANILTGAVEDAVTRADAVALRGGTVENATGRPDRGPVGFVTVCGPVLVLIAAVTVNALWS
jgi:energy-coupling factor transporter transmembrane protein EcfT